MLNAEVFCIFEVFSVSQDSFKSFNEFRQGHFFAKACVLLLSNGSTKFKTLSLSHLIKIDVLRML